jgi:hypothetical protein
MQGGYSGVPPYLHAPIDAAEQLCFEVVYTNGSINDSTVTVNMTQDTLTVADISAIVLYFGGIDSCIEGESLDRYFVAWSPAPLDMTSKISVSGKAIHRDQSKWVVSQMTFRFSPISICISAIRCAGYPGQDGGPAVSDILTNARNFVNVSPCLQICGQGVCLPSSALSISYGRSSLPLHPTIPSVQMKILARSLIDVMIIHFDSIQLLRGWKPFVVPVPLLHPLSDLKCSEGAGAERG